MRSACVGVLLIIDYHGVLFSQKTNFNNTGSGTNTHTSNFYFTFCKSISEHLHFIFSINHKCNRVTHNVNIC